MPYRGVERAPDTAVGHVPDTGVRHIPIKDGDADYFVFNVSDDNGFVIVSGDDRARPVSGHSHEGSFDPDDLPDGLRWMLEYYQDEINWAEDDYFRMRAIMFIMEAHYGAHGEPTATGQGL